VKKTIIFLSIFFLILFTSIIKNSTKKIDDEIFIVEENLRILENRLNESKLEFNYLSSSEKLLEYQKLFFENKLVEKSIKEIFLLDYSNDEIFLNKLDIIE
tara:strand:+ start:737 stop:1039 length:303 start_codon:yes stop_codon:yes gene_type:complete